ncbi:hypothetical protein BN903_19 [Halorubrum sp. AJ67]|nr:hypothetical protein BN903_19 [Halorubrum sp. AJ67]
MRVGLVPASSGGVLGHRPASNGRAVAAPIIISVLIASSVSL